MALCNKLWRPPQARNQYSTDVVRQQSSATKPLKQTHTQMDLTAEERGADRDWRRRVIQGLCLSLYLFLQLTVIWAARVGTPVVKRTKLLIESRFTYEFDIKNSSDHSCSKCTAHCALICFFSLSRLLWWLFLSVSHFCRFIFIFRVIDTFYYHKTSSSYFG